jgi:hypothetical protein
MKKFATALSMIAIASATAAATPAFAQSIFGQITEALEPKSRPQQTERRSARPGALVASINAQQVRQIDMLLQAPLEDQAITTDRQEALPLIKELVATAACAIRPSAWNAMNRHHLKPKSYDLYSIGIVPMWSMKHHDKTICLDPVRITGWSKPAKNTLSFRTYYVAGDSGEAGDVKFTLLKASDGSWMVQKISKW